MNSIICLIFISVWMQVTTAQILAPGLKNQQSNVVHPNCVNDDVAGTTANIASTESNFNNLVANSIARDANVQAAILQASNQAAKLQAINNGVGNINRANFVTGISNVAAASNVGKVNNYGNINGLLNSNLGGYSFGNSKANFATGLSNANNIVAAQNKYANVGKVNNYGNTNGLPNSNVGGYSLRNNAYNGISVNGQNVPQAFGISVEADGLEVGGHLAVNGRLPFYSAVAVNSRIPTDGIATVNYSCGSPVGQ